MARRSKVQIAIDNQVDTAVNFHSQGRRFDIFDLGKIPEAGRDAAKELLAKDPDIALLHGKESALAKNASVNRPVVLATSLTEAINSAVEAACVKYAK